jgi:hypothetical protein
MKAGTEGNVVVCMQIQGSRDANACSFRFEMADIRDDSPGQDNLSFMCLPRQPLGAWPWAIGNVLIFSGESDD